MEIKNYLNNYEELTDEEIIESVKKAITITKGFQDEKDNPLFDTFKDVAFGIAVQNCMNEIVEKKNEEKLKKEKRSKRSTLSIEDMRTILEEYYFEIDKLQGWIKTAIVSNVMKHMGVSMASYDPEATAFFEKHQELIRRAYEGICNPDELETIKKNDDIIHDGGLYPSHNYAWMQNANVYLLGPADMDELIKVNELQREKFYLYCRLSSELSNMKGAARDKYLAVVSEIDKFLAELGKRSYKNIINGNKEEFGEIKKSLLDDFNEGLKEAREKCTVGVNNGRKFVDSSDDDSCYSYINSNAYDTEGNYISNFVKKFIEKNRFTELSLIDIESLKEIRRILNEYATKFANMSDEEFMEYKLSQMHLSEEEIEKYEAKVTDFLESEKIYNGRG